MMDSCRWVTRSVITVASAMEYTMGLLFWEPMAYPPYTDISAIPSTTKVTMVTPVVRERLKSHGLLIPKIPKNIPNRDMNNASFKMKTMVRFSFLIVRKAIHLITLETEIFLPPQGAFLWEAAAMGKQLVQKPPHILRVIIAQALKRQAQESRLPSCA